MATAVNKNCRFGLLQFTNYEDLGWKRSPEGRGFADRVNNDLISCMPLPLPMGRNQSLLVFMLLNL